LFGDLLGLLAGLFAVSILSSSSLARAVAAG